MNVGETFTWTSRDPKDANYVGRTYTLTRTDRPYAYDLCDAYNQARGHGSQFENYVDASGNIRLRGRLEA